MITDHKLLEWVLSLLRREQEEKTYGAVIVHFEGGKITRAKVERSEKPNPFN